MPLVILVCLSLVCLPIEWPTPVFGLGPLGSAIGTAVNVTAMLLIARTISVTTRRSLQQRPAERSRITRRLSVYRFLFVLLNLSNLFLCLVSWGWGRTVTGWLTWGEQLAPGAELLLAAPFLTVMTTSWLIFYDADRALHESRPMTSDRSAMPTRWGHFAFVFRYYTLLVFMPFGLAVAYRGLYRLFPEAGQSPLFQGIGFCLTVVGVLLLPSAVPLILGLKPYPEDESRARLRATAERIGLKYRRFYLWRTHQSLATAMVAGIFAPVRFVVFTDLLKASLSDDEIAGVLGHEAGHVHHRHLLYYAVFMVLSLGVIGMGFQAIELSAIGPRIGSVTLLVISVLFTGVYLFVCFGVISRRCERQADVFGCRAISCFDPHCTGHDLETALAPGGSTLCPTGINRFIAALRRVEELNGMQRDDSAVGRGFADRMTRIVHRLMTMLSTWQHSTIARRTEFLESLRGDLDRERRFQRNTRIGQWSIVVGLVAIGLSIGSACGWQRLASDPPAEPPAESRASADAPLLPDDEGF